MPSVVSEVSGRHLFCLFSQHECDIKVSYNRVILQLAFWANSPDGGATTRRRSCRPAAQHEDKGRELKIQLKQRPNM